MTQRNATWREFCEACGGLTGAEIERIAAPLGTLLVWSMADRVPGAAYAAIVDASGAAVPIALDAQAKWLAEHPEERRRYRGQFVAVHETRGIVASAAGYAALVEQLERDGVADDEIVIEYLR